MFLIHIDAVNAAVNQEDSLNLYADTKSVSADEENGWREVDKNQYYAVGWQEIGGERYYFSMETGAMAIGWHKLNGEKYYFFPDTGIMATGWQEIDGEKYYFFPEIGAMATKWQEIDEQKYYFSPETGHMLKGKQKIANKSYFFEQNGTLCTAGWIQNGSKTYYCKSNGVLVTGWKTIHGAKYYFLPKNNRMAVGSHEIKGSYYIFHDNGKLAQSNSTTIVTAGGKIYCAKSDGKAASGWQIRNNNLYYATIKGVLKRNTTYQGISFTKTGEAKENVASKVKIVQIQTIASITNEKMTKSEKLWACWSYITNGNFRYASKYPNLNASGWQKQTAYDMLTTHTGNCYSFACAFAALASEIGYNPNVICGRVRGSRDRASDGYTRHSWVMIDGKHYDPESHYAGWRRNVYALSYHPVSNQIQKVVAYNG